MLPTIFVHKPFYQRKFSKLICLVLLLLVSSFLLRLISLILILFRVTLTHIVSCLPVRFFQHFDNFFLQSFNWYLVAKRRCITNVTVNTKKQNNSCCIHFNNKFSLCAAILLNLSVNLIRMFLT